MAFQLGDNQKVHVAVSFVDSEENPTTVEGAPTWTSSDDAVLMVEADADGMGATITAVGPLGNGQAQMSADANMGADVTAVQGIFDVEVVASQAVSAVINPGTPEDK